MFLIREEKRSINFCKPPSIGDVLKVLFFIMHYRKFFLSENIVLVIQKALIFILD